jgi:transcriptional regulator GlxA family with amidase domain
VRRRRRIGILAYDEAQALDIVGPLDAFSTANGVAPEPAPYEIIVLGLRGRAPIRTESGLRLVPDVPLRAAPLCDTVIIPGGRGLRLDARLRARVAAWIAAIAPHTRRIASICTGAFALAETGLLDGRRATTHWRYAAELAQQYGNVRVDADAIYVKDERLYTSAGITAGVDLALALIEEDIGQEAALAAARELVVYLKRSGGQMQYSVPLRVQTQATGDLARVVAWMLEHLDADLTVEAIAERMQQSARHVTRRFVGAFGETPASFVEGLRVDAARWRLSGTGAKVGDIALAVGYRSPDAFRRAFERRYGVEPTAYRRRFPS